MDIYVDIKALNNSGDGSKEKPFGTISEAAAIANPGDTVHVAPGVYREYVSPKNGGTEDARITYVSDEPLGATISGAFTAQIPKCGPNKAAADTRKAALI